MTVREILEVMPKDQAALICRKKGHSIDRVEFTSGQRTVTTDDWERYQAVSTVRAIIDEPMRSIEQAIKYWHSYSDLAEYVGDDMCQALHQAHEILNTALTKIE